MAGEEDSNRNNQPPSSPEHSRQYPGDDNPFVAFRRFADEQISSMLQSVMGLPSSVAPPQSQQWAIFADEQNYRDAQLRQRERREREDYNNDVKEHGDAPSGSGAQESPSKQDNTFPLGPSRSPWSGSENLFDIDMFFDSFFDRFWLDDQVSSRFFHPYHRPLFSSLMSADSPAWPVNYLMFSPYSPLHLERQARYRSHRENGVFSSLISSMSLSSECDPGEPKWREAFEDLLRLENGKPMLDRESGAVAKSETGKDWLQGLVKRGSLGDHWKYAAGSGNQPWSSITLERPDRSREHGRHLTEGEKFESSGKTNETRSERLTELDMYDRFLADIEAREREFGGFHQSPLLRFLLEDRRRGRDGVMPPESDSHDDKETWLELVSGGNKHSVPEPPKELSRSTPTPEIPAATPPAQDSYVVSTQINTERVRLADGSIQTRTIKTKRFADGREETNESTEIVNPPQRDQHSPDQQGLTSDQKKQGWFWND
ncbi:hypothetical protein BDW59DRAFT_145683 [Aspergillus cavernicola]|uniref:Uncharacterized protein n=1 Tax=Aspergillus cavernicola TaxID=176166 RepID=A0ABR4IFC9_9EURO